MSDVVTCIASLQTRESQGRFTDEYPDYLCLFANGFRRLPAYRKGRPKPTPTAWEYEERDGRLYITPSLLCTSSGFHTSYNWDVAFALCPQGMDPLTHAEELNPGINGE